jgi:hypothetical protein
LRRRVAADTRAARRGRGATTPTRPAFAVGFAARVRFVALRLRALIFVVAALLAAFFFAARFAALPAPFFLPVALFFFVFFTRLERCCYRLPLSSLFFSIGLAGAGEGEPGDETAGRGAEGADGMKVDAGRAGGVDIGEGDGENGPLPDGVVGRGPVE